MKFLWLYKSAQGVVVIKLKVGGDLRILTVRVRICFRIKIDYEELWMSGGAIL